MRDVHTRNDMRLAAAGTGYDRHAGPRELNKTGAFIMKEEKLNRRERSCRFKAPVRVVLTPEAALSNDRGRFVPLSLPRRWIGDIMHFAKRVPVVAGERTLRIRPLLDARRSTPFAPGWYATIVKGFAMVSARIPELRQAYLPFPYPHLYEHPFSVATAIIDRTWDDEHATFLCPMKHPERRPLIELHDTLQGLKSDPIAAHGPLRRIVRTSRFPRPIRRAL